MQLRSSRGSSSSNCSQLSAYLGNQCEQQLKMLLYIVYPVGKSIGYMLTYIFQRLNFILWFNLYIYIQFGADFFTNFSFYFFITAYLLVVHSLPPIQAHTNSPTFICLCAWLVVLASKPNINKSIPIEKCILFAFARVQIVSLCVYVCVWGFYSNTYAIGSTWVGRGGGWEGWATRNEPWILPERKSQAQSAAKVLSIWLSTGPTSISDFGVFNAAVVALSQIGSRK